MFQRKVAFDVGVLPRAPVRELVDIAVQAEALGFSGVWVADSQSIFREVYPVLTAMAMATDRIMLATGVTNPLTRHPAVTASAISTLDELSGGRVVLGIGSGESAVQTAGLKASRLATLEEYIHTVRGLMAGREVSHRNRLLRLTWSRRDIPIHLASSGPRSLQLAGRVADGVLFQVGATPELIDYAFENILLGARQEGRDRASVQFCMRLATSIDRDRTRARTEIRPYAAAACVTTFRSVPEERIPDPVRADYGRLRQHYDYYKHVSRESDHQNLVTEAILDCVAIAGTPEDAIPRFQGIIDQGVDRIVMPVTGSNPLRMMEMLAGEVFPHLIFPEN